MCGPVAAAVPPDGGTERHARSVTRVSTCSRVTGGRDPQRSCHFTDAMRSRSFTRNMYTVQACAGPGRLPHPGHGRAGGGGGCWFCSRGERGGQGGEPRGGMHTGGTDRGQRGGAHPLTQPSPRGRLPPHRRGAETPGSAVTPPSSKRCGDRPLWGRDQAALPGTSPQTWPGRLPVPTPRQSQPSP